jgi:predicted RNA-binding protein associated with RNAse of E/G family
MKKPIRYEYSRPGKGMTVFDQWLVVDLPDVKVMFMEGNRGPTVTVDGRPALDEGAPAIWFVFPGAWHDVGRFHRSDGTFTGWYTNLCTPFEVRDDAWASTDLFLDHWLAADGTGQWLDEDEFNEAAGRGLLDLDTRSRVALEKHAIDRKLSKHAWPPRVARDMDLSTARRLLETGQVC